MFPFILGMLFLQFIGFQYSAYIAGEVRGNVRRSVLIALLGALAIGSGELGVPRCRLPAPRLRHPGELGPSYWGFNENLPALLLGQPNAMPLLGVIATKGLWPIWS